MMKSVTAGMLLGDANLQINKHGVNAYWQLHHSLDQQDYLDWKIALWGSVVGFTKGYSEQKLGTSVWAKSRCIPFLTEMRSIAYPRGRKEVTQRLLRYLTPIGLAIWFMDDGSIREKVDDKGGIRGRDIRLYTCSFGSAEHDLIIQYFKNKWGVEWHKRPIRNKQGSYFYLGCGAKEAAKLFSIIEPFVVPSMRYKVTFRPNKLRPNVWNPSWVKSQSELHGDVKNAAEMTA